MHAWILLIGLTTGQAESTSTAHYKIEADCMTVARAINSKAMEALKASPGSTQVRASCAEIEYLEQR